MSQAKNPGLAVLKQTNGAEKIGYENENVKSALDKRPMYLGSVAEDINGLAGVDGQPYIAIGWHSGTTVGRHDLVYDDSAPKSGHGTLGWSATVPAVSQQTGADLTAQTANYLDGVGETDVGGNGLFVIQKEGHVCPEWFGARLDSGGTINSAASWKKAVQHFSGARGTIKPQQGGQFYFLDDLNVSRCVIKGNKVRGNTGGGGTQLLFSGTSRIFTSVEDNYGFELRDLTVSGSATKTANGQSVVDMTGQNSPRLWNVKIKNAENGLKLSDGASVESHYGSFYRVDIERCFRPILVEGGGKTQTHIFYGGRHWDCVEGYKNSGTGTGHIVFNGTAFELGLSVSPINHDATATDAQTWVINCRFESAVPQVAAGQYFDIGSYWSSAARPKAFGANSGVIATNGIIETIGNNGSIIPSGQNLLKNARFTPKVNWEVGGDQVPGWEIANAAMQSYVSTPLGMAIELNGSQSNRRLMQHLSLRKGAYTIGYGVNRDDDDGSFFSANLKVQNPVTGEVLFEKTSINGSYRGAYYQANFVVNEDVDDALININLDGVALLTSYHYWAFITPGPVTGLVSDVGQTPYLKEKWGDAEPDDGEYWEIGDFVNSLSPSSGSPLKWITTTTGHRPRNEWQASTAYAVNDFIWNGANTYVCVTAGTSAASGGPTGTGTSITDGTVVWNYVSSRAVFTAQNL